MRSLDLIHHRNEDCAHADVELHEVDDVTLLACSRCLRILERGLPVYVKS